MGGGFPYIPPALVYPISTVSGTGPLWFIQMLFVFSCILALLKKIDKNDRVRKVCKKANLPIILSLFVVIFGAAQILNMPVLTTYRFGIYFVAFLIGYYVFSHEEVQEKIESVCIPMLCLAVIGAVCYTVYYFGSDYTSPECLQSIITNLHLWVVVLAVIGCAKKILRRRNGFYTVYGKIKLRILYLALSGINCRLLLIALPIAAHILP